MNAILLTKDSNKDTILKAWQEAKAKFDEAQANERALRALAIETRSLITDEYYSGTENVDIGGGFDLKIKHRLDYKLDNSNDCEKVHQCIEAFESVASNEGGFIADRLFKQKFELSVTEYKILDPKFKVLVDKILTIKPVSKAIEIDQRKR